MDVEQLYREHSVSLFRYVLRLTGDAEQAADIVQTTFLRLVERPPRDIHAKSWLFRVATNAVFDQSRLERRRMQLLSELPVGATTGDVKPSPAEAVEITRDRAAVRRALEQLSARDRTVLLMRAEGFTHREIAEAIRTNTKSIGVIIARALAKLAAALRLEGIGAA